MFNFLFRFNKKVKKFFVFNGFSLMEVIVGTFLFTLISLVISNMILDLNRVNQKSISEKKIYDSLSIIMDDMTKRIRGGEGYVVSSNSIIFKPQEGDDIKCEKYELIKTDVESKIQKSTSLSDCDYASWTSVIDFSPRDIYIDQFYLKLTQGDKDITGVSGNTNMRQPIIELLVTGHTIEDERLKFKIETTISQRSKYLNGYAAGPNSTPMGSLSKIYSSYTHSCGLTVSGKAYCWGDVSGQIAGDDIMDSRSPVEVPGGHLFSSLSLGYLYTCGLKSDGKAYCWGDNSNGQIGDGTFYGIKNTPTPVSGGLSFSSISVGYVHACGLTVSEGKAYCWGANFGLIGDGTTDDYNPSPTAVSGNLFFSSLDVGQYHTCGLTVSEGKAYCWGNNYGGEIGVSSQVSVSDVPIMVSGNHQFSSLSIGERHSCGLKSNGQAYCWGSDGYGVTGNGVSGHVPNPVLGGKYFSNIYAEGYNTCGKEISTNVMYCWGASGYSKLGPDIWDDQYSPVVVFSSYAFVSISFSETNACGLTASGQAYCWGDNSFGQIGNGSNDYADSPVLIN